MSAPDNDEMRLRMRRGEATITLVVEDTKGVAIAAFEGSPREWLATADRIRATAIDMLSDGIGANGYTGAMQ